MNARIGNKILETGNLSYPGKKQCFPALKSHPSKTTQEAWRVSLPHHEACFRGRQRATGRNWLLSHTLKGQKQHKWTATHMTVNKLQSISMKDQSLRLEISNVSIT